MKFGDVSDYSAEQVENTKSLLKSIAEHLSNHKYCKQKEYELFISADCVVKLILFNVDLRCHSRLKGSERPAIRHIMWEHFNHLISEGWQSQWVYEVCAKADSLVPGKYVYHLYTSGKYRRWKRL
jgi:hypothetical protein